MSGSRMERGVVCVGDARIHYEVRGEGPALVLLHGLSGSTRWWRKNAPVFARRYRVYAVDLVGFGRSRGQHFRLDEAAAQIGGWMDALGEPHFSLVGHSMGGLIAAQVAALRPQQVRQLVLVDAVTQPLGHSLLRSAVHLAEALRYVPLDFLPVLFSDGLRAGPRVLYRAMRALHQADGRPHLAQIAARTLVVWGEWDTLLPVRRGEALHRALPGSAWVLIERAGHNPMWDRPAVFNQVVLDFLLEGASGEIRRAY